MGGLLNNGYSYAAGGMVRFAVDLDRKPGEVHDVHLSPEEIDKIFKRANEKYKNEPKRKRPIVPTPLQPRAPKATERTPEEMELARHTYIELRAEGIFRTKTVPYLIEQYHMSHHEFYKCLRKWGYDDRMKEDLDIEKFINGLF